MTRPSIDPSELVSTQEGWDALLRDILTALTKAPLPVHEVANAAALPDPTTFDRCIVTTVDTNKLWFSNGTAWKEVSLVP